MNDNKILLDSLLKTDVATRDDTLISLNNSIEYQNTKKQLRLLCKTLSMDSSNYEPKKMIITIDSYIIRTDKLDRILYSEISNYIFGLSTATRGSFSTNTESLLMYVLDKEKMLVTMQRRL